MTTIAPESATVEEYMTREVATVSPDERVGDVAERIASRDGFSGFPVTDDGHVEGFVNAVDLLLADADASIDSVMSRDLLVAAPEMDVDAAARVILRSGIRRLPVVDGAGDLIGIISNTDVIRSQIERATPETVVDLKTTIEQAHDVETEQRRREIPIESLRPTQSKVYGDELQGRQYELERGLAEPLVVVDNDGELLLADGHHRSTAGRELGIEEMEAYVIETDDHVDLELEKAAEEAGVDSIEEIEIVDYARHPLIESTERFREES
ncbi:MAG: CBS domain-containing protein [Halococcoides sp.]